MAKQLTPIDMAANDSPITLVTLANNIVNALATEVVTVNTAAAGGLTTGNGYVSGIFGASVLIGGELRGGSVSTSANLVLSSNITGTTVNITIGNSSVNSTVVDVDTLVANSASINYFTLNEITIGNTAIKGLTYQANNQANQTFDSFTMNLHRSAEYLLSLQDTSAGGNAYQLMKILVIHDGGTAHVSEYGIVTTNATAGNTGVIGIINAVSSGANVFVTVSPVSPVTNLELQATRTIMSS